MATENPPLAELFWGAYLTAEFNAGNIDGLGTQVPSPSPIARWPFWSESEAGEDAC